MLSQFNIFDEQAENTSCSVKYKLHTNKIRIIFILLDFLRLLLFLPISNDLFL